MPIEDTEYFQSLLERVGNDKRDLSPIEQRVVKRGVGREFDGVPWDWVEKEKEGKEVVNLILAAMDGVKVEWVDDFGEDDDGQTSFRLEVVKKPDQRAKDKDRLWPEMTLQLRQGEFSYLEMPALLRGVEAEHNRWLAEEGWPEELRVNLVEIWGWRWQRSIEIMEGFRTEIEETLGEDGKEFLDQAVMMVGIVAGMFGNVTETEVSLENELWERELKSRLKTMVNRRKGRDYGDDGKRERLGKAVRKLTARSVKEGLEEEFYELMFERGMAMMIAKSDLREEIKEAFLDRDKMVREGQGDLLEVTLGEEAEVKAFDKLRQELIEARQSGNVKRVSELELEAVNRFVAVLYSEGVWGFGEDGKYKPKRDKYRLVDVLDKKVNCMAIAALEKAVLEKMLGLRVLGGMSRNHMFGVVALTDGRLLSIDLGWSWLSDGEDSILTVDRLRERVNYFGEDDLRGAKLTPFGFRLVGDMRRLYIAGVMDWVKNNDLLQTDRKQRSVRMDNGLLNNTNPDFIFDVALKEEGGKAKTLFELALEKDERPRTIIKLMDLNRQLIEERMEDRGQLWQEQVDLLARLKVRYERGDRDIFLLREGLRDELIEVLESLNKQLSQMREEGCEQTADKLVELNLSLGEYLEIDGKGWDYWRSFLKNVYDAYNTESAEWFVGFMEKYDELVGMVSFDDDYERKMFLIMSLFGLRGFMDIKLSKAMVALVFILTSGGFRWMLENFQESAYSTVKELVAIINRNSDARQLVTVVDLNFRKKFWRLLTETLPDELLEMEEWGEFRSVLLEG